ncbi:MAG: complex I subunit 5 family protein [Solirubrobacteraceae bacterium]
MALTSLAIVVPLCAAVLLAATTSLQRRRVADGLAFATALATCGLCLALVARSGGRPIVAWLGGWTPRGGIALGIDLFVDPLAAGLAAFAAALAAVAIVVSWHQIDTAGHLFHALVMTFLAGMVGFCLAGDMFTAFVFFELMGVSAYALSGFRVDARASVEGALLFAVTNTVGALLLLLGISLLYGRTGALNMVQIGAALGRRDPDALVAVAFALVACGFFVKAAIVPFHLWMAEAYAAAPTSISLLFAGAMSELGVYGVARVYWTVFDGALGPHADTIRAVLLALGLTTALVGGTMCLAQVHLKRMLAFATVGHMGVLLCGIALLDQAGLAGVAVFIIGDGLVKASLFVVVGMIEHRHGSVDEATLYGRGAGEWWLAAMVALAGLALAALPPFGPFLGRALVEDAAAQRGLGFVAPVLVLASGLIGGAVLRIVRTVFLGRGPMPRPGPTAADEPESEDEGGRRLPKAPATAAALLLAGGLAWGLVPGLTAAAAGAAARLADPGAIAAAVLGAGAGPVAPGHAEPLTTSAWLWGLASGALAVGLACARGGAPSALHALHSGRVGDSVAWIAVGAALVASVFAAGLTG